MIVNIGSVIAGFCTALVIQKTGRKILIIIGNIITILSLLLMVIVLTTGISTEFSLFCIFTNISGFGLA